MKKISTLILLFLAICFKAQPPGWIYNQPVTITNPNASSVIDYQMRLVVNTQSLISAGKMTTTGSDIRFGGTCTGSTFFNYWIEAGINTATTVIWVKVPFMAANSSTLIYMFFGAPTQPAASSIPGTFRGPNSATDSVTGGTSGGLLVCQRGFRFSPNQNVLVTHFGKNEPTGSTRYVTLFNYTSQTILSQTQVAGPSATYSYGPIASPLWLTQGTQYVLQIFGTATDGYYYGTSSQIGQHLTYYDMQYSNGGTQNTFPTNVLTNYHYGYGDLLYYVCTTLAITPTYTMGGGSMTITGPQSALCSGATVTLTTNATGSFSWSTGGSATVIVVTPPIGLTNYSVVATSTTGCNSVALITTTVNSGAPTLTLTQNTTTVCPTNTIVMTASGGITYTWTGGVTNGVPFAPPGTGVYTVSSGNGCGVSTGTAGITVQPLQITTLSTPTVICAGGAATLSAVGASSFAWLPGNLTGSSPIVSAASAQIYTVVGTTSVCSGSATVALAVNPIPTIAVPATTYSICEGQSVTLSATGALGYTWTPGAQTGSSIVVSPTTSAAYVVTGTNNFNCSSSANQIVLVTVAPPVTVGANKTNICLGTNAILTAGGGQTYNWQPGNGTGTTLTVSPTATTIYTVTGTNTLTQCNLSRTIAVNVFTMALAVSPSTAICVGGTITVSASGATNYTWTNGPQSAFYAVSPTSNTTYTVSALTPSAGINCPVSNTVLVNVNALPTITAVATRTQVCKNETATVTAGGGTTYLWNNLSTNTTFTVKATATAYSYTVTGTDANGCSNTATVTVKVSNCVGVEERYASGKLALFPNPVSTELSIQFKDNVDFQLVNTAGQVVRQLSHKSGQTSKLSVLDLPKGVYFLVGETGSEKINEKIIVEK